jgi:hypothetical protein
VDVMNGAFGEERYGFSSTDATVNGEPASAATSRVAAGSSTTTTSSRATRPWLSKSLPVATRLPSSPTNVAPKPGSVGKAACRSQ